ncbi:hypothetical protein AQI70_08080 [Streptomyces curacoi]|uniref:Uncharacterized protein n=1 Tax=Streptomyces curacoi TaxID=146536 RepID=A0A117PI91_9ACTN|nr:hypothetical protein AQI70_08080 [Streptomyces curacoi]
MPHHKVLCGTSLEKRLFMMIDVARVDHGGDDAVTGTDDQAQDSGEVLLELARARMMTYFTLASLPPALLRVTPVGRPEAGQVRSARTPCAYWNATLLWMICAAGSVNPPLRERSVTRTAWTC